MTACREVFLTKIPDRFFVTPFFFFARRRPARRRLRVHRAVAATSPCRHRARRPPVCSLWSVRRLRQFTAGTATIRRCRRIAGDEGAPQPTLATLDLKKITEFSIWVCPFSSSSMRIQIIVRPASRDPASLNFAIPLGKYQQNSIDSQNARIVMHHRPVNRRCFDYALVNFFWRGGLCYEINSLFM